MRSSGLHLSLIVLLGVAGALEGCRRLAPGNYSGPQGNREATPDKPATPQRARADQETPAPIVEASPRPGEKLSALATGELMPAPGSAASGVVSVRGDPGGGIEVDVSLRDAPPGIYAVVLGDAQDCDAIGAGGSRQGSAAGSAGVLGTIEVGISGSGTLTTNIPRRPQEAALGTVIVVDQSSGRPTACGVTR